MRAMIAMRASMIAFALPSTALGFSGPWDRAHQPRIITSPNVIVGRPDGEVNVLIAPPTRCLRGFGTERGPVTVTVTTPDASTIGTIKNLCKGSWTTKVEQSSPYLDVSTANRDPTNLPSPELSIDPSYDHGARCSSR